MLIRAAVVGLLLAGGLVGCGTASSSPEAPSSTSGQSVATPSDSGIPSPTAPPVEPPKNYLPVDGVTLTPQGSTLGFGVPATVAWRVAGQVQRGKIAVAKLNVRRVRSVPMKVFAGWDLPRKIQKMGAYFVTATVVNAGDLGLAKLPVPLYATTSTGSLVEASTFAASFKACPSTPLPDKFPRRAKTQACLVYFIPGDKEIRGVTFRPAKDFNPITWQGAVEKYQLPKKPKKPKKKN